MRLSTSARIIMQEGNPFDLGLLPLRLGSLATMTKGRAGSGQGRVWAHGSAQLAMRCILRARIICPSRLSYRPPPCSTLGRPLGNYLERLLPQVQRSAKFHSLYSIPMPWGIQVFGSSLRHTQSDIPKKSSFGLDRIVISI